MSPQCSAREVERDTLGFVDTWFGQTPWVVWALVLVVALFTLLASRWLGRAWQRRGRRWRARRARAGEVAARDILRRHGFRVKDAQVPERWPVEVGNLRVEIDLRADYLVSLDGEQYVAEVKTGSFVAAIRHGPTRRQLLEYFLAYRTHGVVLVDVVRNRVDVVRFPGLRGI